MTVAVESPRQPEVVALIDALDAYQKPLYPPESHHGIDLDALSRPEVVFVVARDGSGRAVGCGAVQCGPEGGELKRMFLRPEQRGAGHAQSMLERLEAEARARGCSVVRLETGIHQQAAIAFYARNGYRPRGPFGHYTDDPMSVYMEKSLPG